MASEKLSIVHGSTQAELWNKTIAQLVDEQAEKHASSVAVKSEGQSISYHDLQERSKLAAKALIDMGIRSSDVIAIQAGNRHEYLSVFLGGAMIGCMVAVLHTTYTPDELRNALAASTCKVLFIATKIGKQDMSEHINTAGNLMNDPDSTLEHVIAIGETPKNTHSNNVQIYQNFLLRSQSVFVTDAMLKRYMARVKSSDVCTLQFTSGTTGTPKASMLTHINIINNARFLADSMRLSPQDTVCCSPPLFHCFGLIMGFLGAFIHGSTTILASDVFDAGAAVDVIYNDKCTAILGVPTMFLAMLDIIKRRRLPRTSARTGLIAGTSVPPALIERILQEMGTPEMLIAYGMTETSPVTFMTVPNDPLEMRIRSLGKVMPHTAAKIVDSKGNVLPIGQHGELCTSGYSLQEGYFRSEAKTNEVMKRDEHGVLWMHTGDQCYMDEKGYCFISGRLKDIIIRGGENIYPAEIEERLLQHPAIAEASVAGIPDERYGEAVGAFLQMSSTSNMPSDSEISSWISKTLGGRKAPTYIWWVGPDRDVKAIPKTGSGKHAKHILRETGAELVRRNSGIAKL